MTKQAANDNRKKRPGWAAVQAVKAPASGKQF